MLVVFDITSEDVKVMDGVPDHLSVGQVRTIAYCGLTCVSNVNGTDNEWTRKLFTCIAKL